MLNIQWFVGEKGLREVTHFARSQMEIKGFNPNTLIFGFRVDKALHAHPEYLSEHQLMPAEGEEGKELLKMLIDEGGGFSYSNTDDWHYYYVNK